MVSFRPIHIVLGALLIAFATAIATVSLRPAHAAGGPLQYSDVCVGDKKITPAVPGASTVVGVVSNVAGVTCEAGATPTRIFFN